jgi:metal-responsive CopG/Arc/MetJ family transcriptional regulator
MKHDPAKIRKDVAAHRERRKAAGRIFVHTDLPGDLVAAIDQLKEARGVRGRTPIIEEALRVYIEKQQGA